MELKLDGEKEGERWRECGSKSVGNLHSLYRSGSSGYFIVPFFFAID